MAIKGDAAQARGRGPGDRGAEDEHVGGGPGDLPEGIRGRLDGQRVRPIKRIILHHTVTPEDCSWRQLSRIGLDRIYRPEGHAHSDHFDPQTGEETFVSYHFLVYRPGMNPDGGALIRRCLKDDEIGWHAGNWPVNCESVAFSFVGDYRTVAPTEEQLRAIADLARGYDRQVGGQLQVQLHHEVAQVPTGCPARVAEARDRLIELLNSEPQPAPQPANPPAGALAAGQLHEVGAVVFGERAPFAPGTALTDAWLAELGGGRFRGRPLGGEQDVPGLPGARCQAFEHGVALWEPARGVTWLGGGGATRQQLDAVAPVLFGERAPFAPGTALTDAWLAELGGGRFRGRPLGGEQDVPGLPGARCQAFEHGVAFWRPSSGVSWAVARDA